MRSVAPLLVLLAFTAACNGATGDDETGQGTGAQTGAPGTGTTGSGGTGATETESAAPAPPTSDPPPPPQGAPATSCVDCTGRVRDLAVGELKTCAVVDDGGVYCWGRRWTGGTAYTPTYDAQLSPTRVDGITDAIQVVTGTFHACALHKDGGVSCWGANTGEQSSSVAGTQTPTRVAGLTNVTQLSASAARTYARRSDGTVRAWGVDSCGMGGSSFSPGLLTGVTNAVEVSVADCHDCIRFGDGAVKCMQYHSTPTPAGDFAVLQPVAALAGSTRIDSGMWATFGVRTEGTVAGPYGYGDATSLATVKQVATGTMHACALLADGTVWCWGDQDHGALGNASVPNGATSAAVKVTGLANVVGISAGGDSTCAILQDGALRCWGANAEGQLGDGSTTERPTPVAVSF